MARLITDGMACACCLSMIANDDDSSCRDYYGHTHRSAELNNREVRQINEETGLSLTAAEWTRHAVPAAGEFDEDGGEQVIYGCDYCDGVTGMAHGYPVSIIY